MPRISQITIPELYIMKKFLILLFFFPLWDITAQSKITVDLAKEHQTIQGFGAFGGIKAYWEQPPFYTDAFVNKFLDDLGSTIVRTNIFWDLEPTNDNNSSNNLDLSKFNYKAGSNLAKQLPYYNALKEAGLKKLIATSWTPPAWMKLHDDPDRTPEECYNCNGCPVGDPARNVCGGRLDPQYYDEYAEYLLAYVKILKQETGIDLYAISIQNEPFFANPFESNVVKPEEFGTLLNVVGKKFRQQGLSTKIFGPEHMAEWSWGVQQNYVSNIFSNGEVNSYLDVYAVHGYVDGVAPDYGSADGWTALKTNISEAYDKPLWMTETSGYPQTLQGAMDLAKSIYLAMRFGDISAWVYWGISAEPGSSFALMAGEEPSILYYVSKQFYKYIRPGAIRVEAESDDAEVLTLAFKNPTDGALSLVIINTGESEKQMDLEIPVGPGEFTYYRTSATENSTEAGVITNTVSLPAESITTLVGYGPSGPSIDEIPNYYIHVGDDDVLEIPLTGISDGNSSDLNIEVTSSDESIVPAPTLNYTYPGATGSLILAPSASAPGRSIITVNLTNQNAVNETTFGFNTTQITFSVEVLDVVTAIKKKERTELKIYPNPINSDFLTLDLTGIHFPRSVEIMDSKGQKIVTVNDNEAPVKNKISINTEKWIPGLYFIKITTGEKRIIEKIVKP